MSQDWRFTLSRRLPGQVSSGAGVPGRCLCIEGKVCCGETFCPAWVPLLLSLSPGVPSRYRDSCPWFTQFPAGNPSQVGSGAV